jgi:hypothetical protein
VVAVPVEVTAAVLVAARTLAEAASAELLNLEADFTPRVRAELWELERAEAELDSAAGGTHHICQRPRRRFAPQPPGEG